MSQLIHELEGRGYVEQVPDLADTRAKIVRLSKRGVALRQACFVARKEIQLLATETLGKTRLAQLQQDLTRLSAALSGSYRS